jgi:hypothetical protein
MKTSFAILAGLISVLAMGCSSSKLLIESGKTKHTFRVNSSIAVTHKGDPYLFDVECKNTCKQCDSTLTQNRWSIDSLGADALVLRLERTYQMDTLSNLEFKALKRSERKKNVHAVLVFEKKPVYVYKTPVLVDRQVVRFEDIQTITYSERAECYKGSPLKSIFHNPNKIRRIELPGAEITLKQKD